MSELRHAVHDGVPPLVDSNSKVLVLGTMLSPKSVEAGFYYAHPQNRFWRVLSNVFDAPFAADTDSRKKLALDSGVALWDVIKSCDIVGAADSTIKNVVYNDIDGLLKIYPKIQRVFATGGTAYRLLLKYNRSINNPIIQNAVKLPSTSPLNCATSFEKLVAEYSVIRTATGE